MPALTLILLGASLVIAPAPVLAQRRLGWLAATRWARPVQDRQGAALSRALTWRVLTGKPFGGAWVGLPAGLAAGVAAGPVPGVLAAATGWGLIRCARLLAAERESEQCRADLAATVAALHDEYAAGATVAAAFTAAAVSSGRFAPAVARAGALARDGDEVAGALRIEGELARLAVACDVVNRSGAPLGPLLAGVRADLAADQRTHRAVRTVLAGPRSSALLLAGLPLIGLAMGAAMGAQPGRVLLHSTAGLLALAAGVVLDLTGVAWTLALSRRAMP